MPLFFAANPTFGRSGVRQSASAFRPGPVSTIGLPLFSSGGWLTAGGRDAIAAVAVGRHGLTAMACCRLFGDQRVSTVLQRLTALGGATDRRECARLPSRHLPTDAICAIPAPYLRLRRRRIFGALSHYATTIDVVNLSSCGSRSTNFGPFSR